MPSSHPQYVVSFSLENDTPESRQRVLSLLGSMGFKSTGIARGGVLVVSLPETTVIGGPSEPANADGLHWRIWDASRSKGAQLKTLLVAQLGDDMCLTGS